MRIISGQYRGRKFNPPNNLPTRPTTDFAKEGLFNILSNNLEIEDLKVLDLFCGTGNISYELASRGCEDITSVDLFPGCIKFIERTTERLGTLAIKPVNNDVERFIKSTKEQYDLIFCGPPYALEWLDNIPEMIFENGLLAENGWLVLEHNPNHDFAEHPNLIHVRNYGKTIFSIFK